MDSKSTHDPKIFTDTSIDTWKLTFYRVIAIYQNKLQSKVPVPYGKNVNCKCTCFYVGLMNLILGPHTATANCQLQVHLKLNK